jgi:hypothetical protein
LRVFQRGDVRPPFGVDRAEISQHLRRVHPTQAKFLLDESEVIPDEVQVKHANFECTGKKRKSAPKPVLLSTAILVTISHRFLNDLWGRFSAPSAVKSFYRRVHGGLAAIAENA